MKKKKKKLLGLMDNGTAVWIGIISFVSIWMFVLGIFVGRGTAPVKFDIEKLQKELVALKEAVLKKEKKRLKVDPDTGTGRIDLSFYEALKETKKNVRSSGTPSQKKEHPEKKVDVRPSPRQIKTASTGHAGTGDGFTIQVASSKDLKAAGKMVNQLKAKGYPAYTTTAKIPEKGIWYRVRIGKFKDRSEARDMLSRLKKNKFKPIVVRK